MAETPDLDALLDSLTTAEQASLTAGRDLWRVVGPIEKGVPVLKVTDGPSGARGDMTTGATSTHLPCGAGLGATWDPALLHEVGGALAEEAKAKGAQVLLAPTVNLHRHPLAGRTFECYGEDPEHVARLAVAFISGLQAGGVGASIKHYLLNEQETERMTISSEVDETTIRELYLRPFEAAVAEADPWTIMASYNRIDGTYASEHHRFLVDVLRHEWGWQGVVVSDWYATHSTVGAAEGGLDLEMPGPAQFLGPVLAEAAERGEVPEDLVREKAARVLRLLERAGRFADPGEQPERDGETPERVALARRAVAAGTTLLRNDGLLPLPPGLTSVAVVGPGAHPGFPGGGGSAQVFAEHTTSPLEGLREAMPGTQVDHARGVALGRFAPPIHPDLLEGGGWRVRFWSPAAEADAAGAPVHEDTWPDVRWSFLARKVPGVRRASDVRATFDAVLTPDVSGSWRFRLTCAGTATLSVDGAEVLRHDEQAPELAILPTGLPSFEAPVELEAGRPVALHLELDVHTRGVLPHVYAGAAPPDPGREVEEAAALAASADRAVVVVGTGLEFETEGEDRADLRLPAGQDALVEAVLAAQPDTVVVLSTGAPVEVPWLDRARAVVWAPFGGQAAGAGLADVLVGDADPGGRLPASWPATAADVPADPWFPGDDGRVRYGEGLMVGYRGHDAAGADPVFPFGHGGSYTTFELGRPDAEVDEATGEVVLAVEVVNTGDRPGSEVVQAYVDAPPEVGEDLRPPRQLAGFTKVALAPGERATVRVVLLPRTFAGWDEAEAAWRVPPGERTVLVGTSSRALTHRLPVEPGARLLGAPQP